MLGACAKDPGSLTTKVEPRELPAWPAFANPVPVTPPTAGEDVRVALMRERQGRKQSDQRLEGAKRWYEGLQADMRLGQ